MVHSTEQLCAIAEAREVLARAGLAIPASLCAEFTHDSSPPEVRAPEVAQSVRHVFTAEEWANKTNKVTRETALTALIDHAESAVVEFPETGEEEGECVGHRFKINPAEYINPKDNVQYSLGGKHGITKGRVGCWLDVADSTRGVVCDVIRLGCCGIKHCDFQGNAGLSVGESIHGPRPASQEVFNKTLGFFAAILEGGCRFAADTSDTSDSQSADDSTGEGGRAVDCRMEPRSGCKGKIELVWRADGRPWVRCEHFQRKQRAHFHARRLDDYDIEYLAALLGEDSDKIQTIEEKALACGYGPLARCNFSAAIREQKQLCVNWHRMADGTLRRGTLGKTASCVSRFDVFVPQDIVSCPQVLMICRHPHSHVAPSRGKTPLTHLHQFRKILAGLGWQLADATPRRLVLNPAFMGVFRQLLCWSEPRNPALSHLHPSLGNLDHVARIIKEMREEHFPEGTGWAGVERLCHEDSVKIPGEQYVRLVKTYHLPNDQEFRLIVCMTSHMSQILVNSIRLSIDTAFKRAQGYMEFEMEAWVDDALKSVTCVRAFLTSESAPAHEILFREVFRIAKEDTGLEVRFRHIHGTGIETIVADAHKGQALGLGSVCVRNAATVHSRCTYHDTAACDLGQMTPYDHLAHFFIQCTNHFERGIKKLSPQISVKVREAMRSLSSATPILDFDGTFAQIRQGGKQASDWLADKVTGSPFMIPALYQPASKIPLEIWKASPRTTNSNEQAHRGINRDGVRLTIVAAIKRGLEYDSRAAEGVKIFQHERIHARDQLPTHFRKAARSITRAVHSQQSAVARADSAITSVHTRLVAQTDAVIAQGHVTEAALLANRGFDAAAVHLHALESERLALSSELEGLLPEGSGQFTAPAVPNQPLFQPDLIAHLGPPVSPMKPRQRTKRKRTKATAATNAPSIQPVMQTAHNALTHTFSPIPPPQSETNPDAHQNMLHASRDSLDTCSSLPPDVEQWLAEFIFQ